MPGGAVAGAALTGVLLAGVVLRFWTRSDLWLDEALSVNIANLPLDEIAGALRRDGHPPLYYFLLHGWIQLFGTGDLAVRALSGVAAVAALPVAWVAGRRYAGRAGGVAALALLASAPFAVRYATEARMYSLVILLVLVGWLALHRAAESPDAGRLVPVALLSGALMLTHYWSFYLLATLGALLLWRSFRSPPERRPTARRLAVAVAAGGVAFLPWLPSFLVQLANTGTPWGAPGRPAPILIDTLRDYGGAVAGEGDLLGWAYFVLVGVAAFATATGRHRLELDLRTRPAVRPELVVVGGTLAVGVVAGLATASAFESRYTATVFPLFVLLTAAGVTRLPRPVLAPASLVVLVVGGLAASGMVAWTQRTQVGEIGEAVTRDHQAGDLVVFCPDQLGPGVGRNLPDSVEAVTYPAMGDPRFVDWTDYADRVAAVDPAAFAADAVDRAGPGAAIWLVWSSGYRTHQGTCEAVLNELANHRGPAQPVVAADADIFEPANLHRYAPAG